MQEKLVTTQKDRQRMVIIAMVLEGKITNGDAAKRLRISKRQIIRLKKSYKEKGDAGLIHGNRGRAGGHRKDEAIKTEVIEKYKLRYSDFGPTFACEKMVEEYKIEVDKETLRRWLLDEGLWKRARKSAKHRQKRERKARFGEMIQIDGSFHKWFEERGEKSCIFSMKDDATGIALSRMDEWETSRIAVICLRDWCLEYGIPMSVYSDKGGVFYVNRKQTLKEELKGEKALTRFGKVCEKLGIEMIESHTPQGRGRIERNHGIDQDRLIKEMRLAKKSELESANRFLKEYYNPKMNAKFSIKPKSEEDAHIPLGDIDINTIFCFEEERKVANDFTVQNDGKMYQLEKQDNLPRPKSKVIVREWMDKSIHIYYNNMDLCYKEIENGSKNCARFRSA